ncbi:MAG: hypothetical protein IPI64_00015 [Chloracidobacterium sp.]|nr:hypothetical protein [Chloracidobacterium sp.]
MADIPTIKAGFRKSNSKVKKFIGLEVVTISDLYKEEIIVKKKGMDPPFYLQHFQLAEPVPHPLFWKQTPDSLNEWSDVIKQGNEYKPCSMLTVLPIIPLKYRPESAAGFDSEITRLYKAVLFASMRLKNCGDAEKTERRGELFRAVERLFIGSAYERNSGSSLFAESS